MAFCEATRLSTMYEVASRDPEHSLHSKPVMRQWCEDLDKALDAYDEAAIQICSLNPDGEPCPRLADVMCSRGNA